MMIVFFIVAVVVSLPVAAIVLVSLASRREDRKLSLGRPAGGRLAQTARRILDFSTETSSGWPAPPGTPRVGRPDDEPARSRRRIDSPLQNTKIVSFRQAA
jgi:hypothetical protein